MYRRMLKNQLVRVQMQLANLQELPEVLRGVQDENGRLNHQIQELAKALRRRRLPGQPPNAVADSVVRKALPRRARSIFDRVQFARQSGEQSN
jgi:hypothetical protein